MRTFENTCAQGDVCFVRCEELPDNLTEIKPDSGRVVVAHSETGHDHAMVLDREAEPAVRMYGGDNPLVAWLQVNRPTALEHQRPYDAHEPILFGPGIYEIRRQREYVPDGFRRVED